jgi:hypothetical protein
MSVSSNSRKESTESFAAQQMHSTMGIAPALAQLNDTNMVNDLPSRVASSSDTNVPEDVVEADILADDGENASKMPEESIDEAIPPGQPTASDKTQGHS